jgi:hypothetical protein
LLLVFLDYILRVVHYAALYTQLANKASAHPDHQNLLLKSLIFLYPLGEVSFQILAHEQ